ncbi:MAG: hypothetical protein Rubg2KO_37720 [Rubricoccaceae bacterium]
MDLVYAQHTPSDHSGLFGPIQEVEDDWQLIEGIPQLEDWPSDAYFEQDDEFGIRLDDAMKCSGGLMVISDTLRAALEAELLSNVEMLPVTLLDLKKRPIQTPYVLFHPIHPQDALDYEASGAKPNAIDPDLVQSVERLAIREDALDPGVRVFRLAGYVDPIFFERSLAERLIAEGFTGIGFGEIDTYDPFSIF